MNAETVADLCSRDRRSDDVALVDRTGREYDRHWVVTSAWKAGNFLRHAGVRRGTAVGVVGRGPLPLLSFFGTALLEGRTRFEPPVDLADARDVRALVAPADACAAYELPPGAQRIGYGRQPDAPDVRHLEAGLWSENPSFPPLEVDPGTPVLEGDGVTYSHGDLVAAAEAIVADWGLEPGTRVSVRAPLSEPRAVAGGVIAPLLAGAVVVLSDVPEDGDRWRIEPGGSEPVGIDSIPLEAGRS